VSQGISSDQPQGRITTLDGFRALAILSVLAFHYTVRWSPEHDPAAHLAGGAVFAGFAPFEYGWLGVELFFIISGFVIWMTLERCATIGEFARRRIARITPALVCAAVLTSLVVILLGPKDWTPSLFDFASSVIPVDPRLFTPQGRWVDGAYWTLFVEARFYVLAALAFRISRKNFAWLWLALQLFVFVGRFEFRQDYTFNLVFFPQYFSYFTLGIFVYEVYARKVPQVPTVVAALLAASLVLLQARFGSQPYGGSTPWIVVSVNLAILALFVLFLFDHPVLKVFRLGAMVWLGEIS
jgi:peptidoglycan/LPS O-acetylase OafA/YrhL